MNKTTQEGRERYKAVERSGAAQWLVGNTRPHCIATVTAFLQRKNAQMSDLIETNKFVSKNLDAYGDLSKY